jgi:hypothetical protein
MSNELNNGITQMIVHLKKDKFKEVKHIYYFIKDYNDYIKPIYFEIFHINIHYIILCNKINK